MIFGVSVAPYLQVHGTSTESATQLVQALADTGIRGIRVSCPDPERDAVQGPSEQNLIRIAQESGLRICAHAPATDISATDPVERDTAVASVRRAITSLASRVSDVVIAVHPESFAPRRRPGDDAERVENCRRSLASLADTASGLGARIALENMRRRPDAPNRTGIVVDQLLEIVAGMDPATVGLCFDTGHANISETQGPTDAFQRAASRVIHIHLDDNLGDEDLHLPPGGGNIDFQALLHTARESGYAGMVELEVPMPVGDDPLAFYTRNHQYFRHTAALTL